MKRKYIISTLNNNIIFNRYAKLLKDLDEVKNNDTYSIIHNFLDGKMIPLDYTKKSMHDKYSKYVPEIFLESILDTPKQDELDLNLIKLKNAAYEYQQILKYNYIVEDVKNRYEENKENKSLKKEEQKLLKEIAKDEKKIIALTKKTEKSRFSKGNEEISHVKQNNIIKELKDKYKEYDKIRIDNIILENINEASTIKDVFNLASLL